MDRQIATFSVGNIMLGFDIQIIKEVYRHINLTQIPGIPTHVAGLMNLRGKIVTVIDLGVCLNIAQDEKEKDNRLLIMKTEAEVGQYQYSLKVKNKNIGNDIVGFLIDHMSDVLEVKDTEVISTPPNVNEVDTEFIEGVIELGNDLVILLDVAAILDKVLEITNKTEEN